MVDGFVLFWMDGSDKQGLGFRSTSIREPYLNG